MFDYQIKRISNDSLKDISFLYGEVSNLHFPIEFFEKKFSTQHTGKRDIGFIAYDNENKPAAYYGVFPCIIEYDKIRLVAAQSGDTMTHPKHQGKGLFTRLAKMTYELAEKEGIKFIFGFPNKNSYPGFIRKLGWIHKENMRTYIFNINTLPIIKAAKKFNLNVFYRFYSMVIFNKYISKSTSFNNSVINSDNGGVLHDDPFFNYKTYSENFIIELEGVKMWIKLDGKLWIGDVERTSIEKFNKALRRLRKLCFLAGCTQILWNLSPNSYWDILLSKEHSYKEGLPIGFMDFESKINFEKIKFTGGDFDTF